MLELPVGAQRRVGAGDARAIAGAFGLTLRGAPEPLGGAVNGVARLSTDRGAVVARVHRPWTTPARLESVHAVQERLRGRGLPVPAVLRAITGAGWARLGDRLVEVTEYTPNDGPAKSWDHMDAAMRMFGRLHGALAEMPPAMVVPPAYSSYATPEAALHMLEETAPAFQSPAGAEGSAQAKAVRAATYDLLRTLAAARAAYAQPLPVMLIHGDYGADNVLMRGHEVAAIIDFDFMAARERVFDLAYTLYWTLDRLCASPAPAGEEAVRRAGQLLTSYAQSAPALSPVEYAALPYEMARVPLYPIAEAGYLADLPYAPRPAAQTLAFARHVPIAQRLVAEARRRSHMGAQAGAIAAAREVIEIAASCLARPPRA